MILTMKSDQKQSTVVLQTYALSLLISFLILSYLYLNDLD